MIAEEAKGGTQTRESDLLGDHHQMGDNFLNSKILNLKAMVETIGFFM